MSAPKPIRIPINGILDLHTFSPKEVKPLLTDYIRAAQEKKITSIKIIHGKGQGILKRKVHSQLSKMPQVADFYDGGYGQGGWGVTIAILKI